MRTVLFTLFLLTFPATAEDLPRGAVIRLGNAGFRHQGIIQCVLWSSDGKYVVSAGLDERVSVWDVSSGRRLVTASCAPQDQDIPLALSHDGRYVAVGGWANQNVRSTILIALWDLKTQQEIRQIRADTLGKLHSLAFSRDGKFIASGGSNGEIRLWDVATGNELRTMQYGKRGRSIRCLAFSPDGKALVSAGDDPGIQIWDYKTGKLKNGLSGHRYAITRLCFTPDGKTLVSGGWETAPHLWDLATGKSKRLQETGVGYLSALDISANGKYILWSASSNSLMHVAEIESGKIVGKMKYPGDGLRHAVFSPDGKKVATGGNDAIIRLWDLATFKEIEGHQGHTKGIHGLAFSPDGTRLATTSPDKTVRVWDLKTGRELSRADWPHHYWIYGVAFSPEGRTLGVGGHKESRLLSAETGKTHYVLKGQEGVGHHVAFSPDGKRFITASNAGTLCWWDTATGKMVREEKEDLNNLWSMVCSEEHELLLDSFRNGGLSRLVWGTKKHEFHVPWSLRESLYIPVVSGNGHMFAATDNNRSIHLLETNTLQRRLRFDSDQLEKVQCLAFSRDGKLLATGSADSTVLVWDTTGATGKMFRMIPESLEDSWIGLGRLDGKEAYESLLMLVANPEKAAPFLDRCLQGVNDRAGTMRKLIADLDSARFAIREKATKALLDQGAVARPYLEEALRGKPSLEAKKRMETILGALPTTMQLPPLTRELRAIEALERMGTPEAKKVLERLSKGEEDRISREAKMALQRWR